MKLLAVSVSKPRTVLIGRNEVPTGIYKEPVEGKVRAGEMGLEPDGQADLVNHGGIYKAVYSYPHEHYAHWSRELKRNDFRFGQFGENLTLEGLDEDTVFIGDVFRIGDVLLEVTQPRVPCFKLAHKMQSLTFPKMFAASGRTGFYQRVAQGGELGAGDAVEKVSEDPRRVSVREMMNLAFYKKGGRELLERALSIPALTPSWREDLLSTE